MNILVCIKQIPDLEQIGVSQAADGHAVLDESVEHRMNRFDEFAIEEAIRIRTAIKNVRVEVLTVGTVDSIAVVKRAIGMGADRGVHIKVTESKTLLPNLVSTLIARYTAEKNYHLILTGVMSEDGMHGQVAPMIAARLRRPCATQIVNMSVSDNRDEVFVEREVDGGARERLRLRLPAVVSVQTGINQPRYPSLSNLLRANRQKVETVVAGKPDMQKASVDFKGMVLPARTRNGLLVEGTSRKKAEYLLNVLKEKALV